MKNKPIDLRIFRDPLHQFLKQSLDDFVQQHGKLSVSTVAFYVFPYQRVGGICLDTPNNSARQVAEWQDKDPFSYGEDQLGRFNHIPEDFTFAEFADFEFEGMPNLYDVEDPLEFIDANGSPQSANRPLEGDEGVNRAMFPTLCAFLREFSGWHILSRSNPFRIGVVMHGSSCSHFLLWPLEEPGDARKQR